jgi:polygalacturonase
MKFRATIFACAVAFTSTSFAAPKILLVNDFGAKGDSTTLDTAAIQKAIDKAAPKKQTVSFKPGSYLTGAIFLKSGVTLDVPDGVTLTGSQHIEDYPEHATRIAGIEMTWPTALINIRDAHDVTLTGKGIIDGNGAVWWKVYNDLRAVYTPKGLRWA